MQRFRIQWVDRIQVLTITMEDQELAEPVGQVGPVGQEEQEEKEEMMDQVCSELLNNMCISYRF